MSDYIYMLESHLSPDQNRVVEDVQAAAGQANVNVFLTGGAMRDMLAGFRIRDLDFVVEGNALKVAKALCEHAGAKTVLEDDTRKSAELVFPTGVTAQIAMSRQEKSARAGGKPQVTAATIQEDLRGRDFTCNAIALSLNKASRGLLLDPMNGLADIERHELRASSAYGFYDDPSRLLRLVRFRVRLGFTVEERTQMQVANAREAGVEKHDSAAGPGRGAEDASPLEDNPAEILRALEEAGLLTLFSPVLAGPKSTWPGSPSSRRLSRLLPDDRPFARGASGTVPVRAHREADAQGEAGPDRHHRDAQSGGGSVAEAGSARQEAGDGASFGAHQEALAGVPHRLPGGAGRGAVSAVPFGPQTGAGAAAELLPEISARDSGDHRGRVGRAGRQARDAAPRTKRARSSSPTAWTAGRLASRWPRRPRSLRAPARPSSRPGGTRRRQADAVGKGVRRTAVPTFLQ